MKKTIVSVVIIGAFVIYCFLYGHSGLTPIVPTTAVESRPSSSTTTPASTSTPNTTGTPGATATPAPGALYYVNRTANEIAYKDILSEAQTKLGIKVFYTLTNTKAIPRNWPGLSGRINEQMILEAVPDYDERTFYLSGPPRMVRAYEHVLKNMRLRHDQVKKDFFPGLV